MRIALPNFGRLGINKDLPAYDLPPGFLSDGSNFVLRDGRMRSAPGYIETLAGATIAPYLAVAAEEFWVYAGQDKIYAVDNVATHTNITRQAAAVDVDYTGSEQDIWTGAVFNGIPVLNNGVDAPQIWATPLSASTKMADMDYDSGNTWDDLGYACAAMRPYRNYLIAMDVTKASRDPYMVKWSHAALPGALPADWDETDDTIDAGEFSLTDGEDYIIDGRQLGRQFVVYKERSAWLMRYVGGGSVMAFDKLFAGKGILARRCVCSIPGTRHFVVSDNDIYIHDGDRAQSIADSRVRRYFLNNLDSANFRKVQCVAFLPERQVWVIYPERNQSQCNKALIWSWDSNVWSPPRDLPNIESLAIGVVDSELTWEGIGTLEWESANFPWDQSGTQGKSETMIMLDAVNSKFYLTHSGEQDDGSSVRKYVERCSIPIQRAGRQGQQIIDLESVRTVLRIFPKITTDPENTDITIYVGTQMKPSDAITWGSAYTFNPSTDDHVDIRVTGRLISIRIEAEVDASFFVDGLEVEFQMSGMR